MPNHLIVGHSLVKRIKEHIESRFDERLLSNFGLQTGTVECVGRSGLTVQSLLHEKQLLDNLLEGHKSADTMFIQLGGNDFSLQTTPYELAMQIVGLAALIKGRHKIKFIVFGYLLPRFKAEGRKNRWSLTLQQEAHYNVWAEEVNKLLAHELREVAYAKAWEHNGFSGSRTKRHWFLDDGVHLAPQGQFRLYRSIRGALILASHKTHSGNFKLQ